MIHLTLFYFLGSALVIQSLFCFQVKFKIVFFKLVKNGIGILKGIVLYNNNKDTFVKVTFIHQVQLSYQKVTAE